MPSVEIAVPDGCYPGDIFVVTGAEGQELEVAVPDGCGPGTLLSVDLPDAAPSNGDAAGETEQMIIEVPAGLSPGDVMAVSTAWGGEFEISVPDGVGPGDQIEVTLPTQAAHEASQPAPDPPVPPLPQKPAGPGGRSSQSSSSSTSEPFDKSKFQNLSIPPYRGGIGESSSSGSTYGGGSFGYSSSLVGTSYTAGGGGGYSGGYSRFGLQAPAPAPAPATNTVAGNAEWAPATSLFAMGPSEGFGKEAGEFHIGQLVQVSIHSQALCVFVCVCFACVLAPLSDLHRVCCVCVCVLIPGDALRRLVDIREDHGLRRDGRDVQRDDTRRAEALCRAGRHHG